MPDTLPPSPARRGPWWWVPSLYFAEGMPYVVVMTVAVIMFKRLGVPNPKIALYTSLLYAPYALKAAWSPLVQKIGTRRSWVVVMQIAVAAGLACVALAIPLESFLRWSLVALAFVAVSSATHDVAADGFYLLALSSHEQAWFVGIRSTAYRMAMIAGQGLLVMLAGALESATGLPVVEVPIRAVDREPAAISLDAFEFPALAAGDGAQRIVVAGDAFELSLYGRSATEAKSIIDTVRQWNVSRGMYAIPEDKAKSDDSTNEAPGWRVSLERFIRDHFGPASPPVAKSDRVGDVAVVMFRLTHPVPPGEQQIVQFGRTRGDPSFQIVEGERFVLSEKNCDKPFAAAVQVDAKLTEPSSATYDVRSGNLPLAWSITFWGVAGSFVLFSIYHWLVMPRPAADGAGERQAGGNWVRDFVEPFVAFLYKERIVAILAFLLLYRFAEAQLVKLATPFLLDAREVGGLALTTGQVGFVYGTVGVIMLTLGGILGGFAAARHGLKRWLWPMALIIHLPNAAFLYLAYAQPENLWAITAAVGIEQFGYGFGFTAYMLYCVYVARGKFETVHYAICTTCMALGMMIPGMWSGWLQNLIGYQHFFIWIMLATIPSFLTVLFIPLDPEFGKSTDKSAS